MDTTTNDDTTVIAEMTDAPVGEFGWHEAMGRAHLAVMFFEHNVEDHPAVKCDADLAAEATKIGDALVDFYQKVAAKRFAYDEKKLCEVKTPIGPCEQPCEPGKTVCEGHEEE